MVLDLKVRSISIWRCTAQSKAKVAENQALEEAMEAMLALGYKATELKKIKKFFGRHFWYCWKLHQVCPEDVGEIGGSYAKRCGWVKKWPTRSMWPITDEEWGRPCMMTRRFWVALYGTYQAGLSWETVLNKRQTFRESFHGCYHSTSQRWRRMKKLESLLDNPAIIRNHCQDLLRHGPMLKPLQVQEELDPFDAYLLVFCQWKTINNDVPDYRRLQLEQLFREVSQGPQKSVVLSSPDQSQFYPTYK